MEIFDSLSVFPRWKRHSRSRIQTLTVFIDGNGYVIHVDKRIYHEPISRHQWCHMVEQTHILPDHKRAEIFNTYRNMQFSSIGGAMIEWVSHETNPSIFWMHSKQDLQTMFDRSPQSFELSDHQDPSTRKRCGWVLFLQPSRESLLQISDREKKRLFRLKSAVRSHSSYSENISSSSLQTKRSSGDKKKKRVVVMEEARDPLNSERERELLQMKRKNRKLN